MGSGIGKSIVRNVSIMFGAQVVTWISSFVLLYFLPRYLGSEDFGRLYLALSISMILSVFIDFGGGYLIPKQVARSEKNGVKILNSYIILRVLLWILSLGIIYIVSDLLGYSESVKFLIFIFVIARLIEGVASALSTYFNGIERTEYSSMGKVSERIFVAIVAVTALLWGATSAEIAMIMAVGVLVNLIVIYYFSTKFMKISLKFNFSVLTQLKSGMPYFLFALFSIVYYRIDAIMLSSMASDATTGWYGGAYRFFDMVMILPVIYNRAIFPIFSKLWENEDGLLHKTFCHSLRFIVLLAVPVSILIFIYSEHIISFFMGLEEFGPSVILLKIFALSIPVIYVDLIFGSAIMGGANRQRGWAVVGFVAIFINIGANYFMIPYAQSMYLNGGIGAAVATLVTELFMLCSALYLLPGGYLKGFRIGYIAKPVMSGILMMTFLWFLNSTGLYWMIVACAGGGVYLAGLFLFRLFDEQEIRMIKSMASFNRIKMILSNKNI